MKRKKSLPWWTEYLGITIDLRFFARKTWKAYLFNIAPIAQAVYLLFVPSTTLPTSKPQDVDQHIPSRTVTFEVPPIFEVASPNSTLRALSINVSDPVSVMDHEFVPGQKFPSGSIVIVPLTGSMTLVGQGVVIASTIT